MKLCVCVCVCVCVAPDLTEMRRVWIECLQYFMRGVWLAQTSTAKYFACSNEVKLL